MTLASVGGGAGPVRYVEGAADESLRRVLDFCKKMQELLSDQEFRSFQNSLQVLIPGIATAEEKRHVFSTVCRLLNDHQELLQEFKELFFTRDDPANLDIDDLVINVENHMAGLRLATDVPSEVALDVNEKPIDNNNARTWAMVRPSSL